MLSDMISRRKFIQAGVLCGLALPASSAFASELVTEDIELTYNNVKSNKIHPSFNNYKICFMSDLHCGPFMSESLLQKSIELASNEKPDLLILGGDYIGLPESNPGRLFASVRGIERQSSRNTEQVEQIYRRLGNALKTIQVKDGIFAVMGNHDHWNNGELCVKILSEYGVKFLINDSVRLSKDNRDLVIYGTDDYLTSVPKVSRDFIQNNKNNFKILVSHNPDFIAETVKFYGHMFDLALAGHTHGGQIIFKGIGAIAGYGVKSGKYESGLVKEKHSIIYTTRGIGVVGIPCRINCRPEISIFKLESTYL